MKFHHRTPPLAPWRLLVHRVIYEADTPSGKAFDVSLIISIIMSVTVVLLDSIESVHSRYGVYLAGAEWIFTVIFTVEYGLRLISVRYPLRYAVSFFGLVDLLAIIPTYLSLLLAGTETLLVIRILRLLRIFRVFKLSPYLFQADELLRAIRASKQKIVVFITSVLTIAFIMGALMYLVEGDEGGFTSIPRGIYWAIVTMTTVGYGDIAPQTVFGQVAAAGLMILGYGIIAIPTGIISAKLALSHRSDEVSTRACPDCSSEGHDVDALYCKVCGAEL